jgi:uncharacterized protein YbjQ (UPF0145 family)
MTPQEGNEPPHGASARVARIRDAHAWDAALSAQEFTAVTGVGFDPVGQVLGAAVYHIGDPDRTGCRGEQPTIVTTLSSASTKAPFHKLVRAMYEARRVALARSLAECTVLGGDGVVGVRIEVGPYPAGGFEVTATGTAVRARSKLRPPRPFTSHITGQEFNVLVRTGYIPVGVVLGICIATRHEDWRTREQLRRRAGNGEIIGWTELINDARSDARAQLQRDARSNGGDGVVLGEMHLQTREQDCPSTRTRTSNVEGGRDYIAEALFYGTSITRFGAPHSSDRPLTIMHLNQQQRGGQQNTNTARIHRD